MKPLGKVGIILGGYAAAFLLALGIVAGVSAFRDPAIANASSGMYAFGDSLMFLGVFGITSVPPTGYALYTLRASRAFWNVFSVFALAIAATGVAAIVPALTAGANENTWSAFAFLRMLLSPFPGLLWFVSALFAPTRRPRLALLAATGMEAAAFAGVILHFVMTR